MEYQKIINLVDNKSNQPSKFEQKIGLEQMINQEERMMSKVKLDLKLQC